MKNYYSSYDMDPHHQQPQYSQNVSQYAQNNVGMNPHASSFVPSSQSVRPGRGMNIMGYGTPIQQNQRRVYPPSSTPHANSQPYQARGGSLFGYNSNSQNNGAYNPNVSRQQSSYYMQAPYTPMDAMQQDVIQHPTSKPQMSEKVQQDVTNYPARFLAAVQERVAQPRPSSASAVQGNANGTVNGSMSGTSLQNIHSMDMNGVYYLNDEYSAYDFEEQHQQHLPIQLSKLLLRRIEDLRNKLLVYEIQIGLEQLFNEPSEYDAWCVAIRQRLMGSEVEAEDLLTVAWMIIEMGIHGENCQYNFARLCAHLYERLPPFKDVLLNQINSFHNIRDQFQPGVAQNLLIFTAEVYAQAFSALGVVNHPVPAAIYEQIKDQLKQPSESSVKTVDRVLKLCGRFLESDIGKERMDDIYSTLQSTASGDLPKVVQENINKIVDLRKANWASSTDQNVANRAAPAMDLTDEEMGFLELNGVVESNANPGGHINSELDDPDGMYDDYEKFLRETDAAHATAVDVAEHLFSRASINDGAPEDRNNGSKPRS